MKVDSDGAFLTKVFLWDSLDGMQPWVEAAEHNESTEIVVYLNDEWFAAESNYYDCTVMAASYSENKLVDVKSVRLDKSNDRSCNIPLEELGLITEGTDGVRVFVWKDLENMIPLDFTLNN